MVTPAKKPDDNAPRLQVRATAFAVSEAKQRRLGSVEKVSVLTDLGQWVDIAFTPELAEVLEKQLRARRADRVFADELTHSINAALVENAGGER